MNKDSFHDDTDFVSWWTTLLLLQTTKASIGIREATHMDALDDACEIIEENTGCSSRWSMEIMTWKMKCKSGAQSGDLADYDDMDAVNYRNALRVPHAPTPAAQRHLWSQQEKVQRRQPQEPRLLRVVLQEYWKEVEQPQRGHMQ